MAFGRAFETRKEAEEHAQKVNNRPGFVEVQVRKLNKKIFPRRKKLFHVGTFIDFLNFA